MKSVLIFVLSLFTFSGFAQNNNFSNYVDPFIGTGGHGHTYPGAVLPHGMVQLSPDTRLDGWDGCGGYHYSDSFIYGFSHTHLSGTGVSDYGDILLMPMTGKPSPDNKIYGSKFSHKNEMAKPGYYSVKLDDDGIFAELTTTERVGLHHYQFPAGQNKLIILDLEHRDEVLESSLKVEDSVTISGLRRSKAWAVDQYVYFVIRFSKPFSKMGVYLTDTLQKKTSNSYQNQKDIKAYFEFSGTDQSIYTKVAISQVSVEGAHSNMKAEMPGWDFARVKNDATKKWNKELSKIEIKGGSKEQLITFYTALYHTMVVPSLANDVDGQYRGRDLKIHSLKKGNLYTVFSLWDTYRAANPLYTIIDKKRTQDYINTFLLQYQQGGRLPVWELSSNETDCMIGYHSIPVIVDAYMKGINDFDKELALEAMKKSANWNHFGLSSYMEKGFIEIGDDNESVSKTLEYAYDDWCIAQFAKSIGHNDDYETYIKRAQNYKNLLDPETGLMRPRINGDWISPFDPREVNNYYTEANSWQYSFYVPQDLNTYAFMQGGKKKMEKQLDNLFSANSETTGRNQSDITGLIGQYAHGNEPSHHISYLYNFAGAPWKTQEKVHEIMTTLYHHDPDGLSGNEDCGQMSAWYVMSALGFYMVTPGSNEYMIGTPQFPEAVIHLENGKTFTIKANNVSDKNFYIQSANLNGKPYSMSYFDNKDLENGGTLIFSMGDKPSSFGTDKLPETSINEHLIVINPVIKGGNEMSYFGKKTLSISANFPGSKIYYTTDGNNPEISEANLYKFPFEITKTCTVKAIAVDAKGNKSLVTESEFISRENNYSIVSLTPFEPQYAAGGEGALIDDITGTAVWRKGNWQGFRENLDVVIDMGEVKSISQVTSRFLQDSRAWIIMPKEVSVEISLDGKSYTKVFSGSNFLPIENMTPTAKGVVADFSKTSARFVRVKAIQYGKMPSWFEEGGGGDSHIFADEIMIK